MGPATQFFTDGLQALIDAVGDHADRIELAAGAITMIVPAFRHLPEIAVAAGHRQHLAGVEEARAAHQTVFERTPEAVVASADVTDGREPAIKGVPEHARCVYSAIRFPGRV